jgi:hypothetical protein
MSQPARVARWIAQETPGSADTPKLDADSPRTAAAPTAQEGLSRPASVSKTRIKLAVDRPRQRRRIGGEEFREELLRH